MALSAEALLEPIFSSIEMGNHTEHPESKVILADYNGWWAPLTHLFYSNTSRCLVSAHPESSVEEVESYYCPHCLTYFAEAEAATSGNRCPKCFECPDCQSTLAIVPHIEKGGGGGGKPHYQFRCGYCHWSSSQIGLVEEDPEFLGMTVSVAERDSSQEHRFRTLLSRLRRKAVENARDRSLKMGTLPPPLPVSNLSLISTSPRGGAGGERGRLKSPTPLDDSHLTAKRWHLSDLEAREAKILAKDKETYDVKTNATLYTIDRDAIDEGNDLSSENEMIPAEFLAMTSLDGITRADQRLGACLQQPADQKDLKPLRKPLFTKRSRRCRKDVNEGRPGILLKPKVNPLEGDSSMRSNVGKWWQKDSSAINVLPTISVINQHGIINAFQRGEGAVAAAEDSVQLIIKLTNPVNGRVNATLVPEPKDRGISSYRRHLKLALGEDCTLYQVDLWDDYEMAATATLQSFEDEYLDDEDSEETDEQAMALATLPGPKSDEVSPSRVLLQKKYSAWFQIAVQRDEDGESDDEEEEKEEEDEDGDSDVKAGKEEQLLQQKDDCSATVGILLFLRLSSPPGEFVAEYVDVDSTTVGSMGQKATAAGVQETPSFSIVVPVCLVFGWPRIDDSSSMAPLQSPPPASSKGGEGGGTEGSPSKKQSGSTRFSLNPSTLIKNVGRRLSLG